MVQMSVSRNTSSMNFQTRRVRFYCPVWIASLLLGAKTKNKLMELGQKFTSMQQQRQAEAATLADGDASQREE